MKLCITTLEYPPDVGGVGQSVKRIGSMLADLGNEVHIVVFHSKQRLKQETAVTEKGFRTTREGDLTVHRFQTVSRTKSQNLRDFLSDVYAELRRLHERESFDIFHGFFINQTGFLTTLLAREVDRPVINSVRGADLHRSVFSPQDHSQIQWTLENSNWLTFVSRELEKRAHVLAPRTVGRTTAFWNSIAPIDFDDIETPKTEFGLNGTVISTFGNFRDKKGIDYLIGACAKLSLEIDLTLLFVGDFIAKERDHWQRFIRSSGIEERIVVTGRLPREQALGFHHVSDIFAIPSVRDGCPNALIEAMLAGKAVVGSNADAIGEIIEHGVDGLAVAPGDTKQLADALRRLADDPELRSRLGRAARRKAKLELAPERERDDWLAVYDRVISRRKPAMIEERTSLAD